MLCCNCGKKITEEESRAMIFESSALGFEKYKKGSYYCCLKCDGKWQNMKKKFFDNIVTSKHLTQHEAWLYLFFEHFLCDNSSRRKLV